MRKVRTAFLLLLLTGCTALTGHYLDQRFGLADPTRYDLAASSPRGPFFERDVRPIIERRCTVCHGCYDAPCQLKLTSWEGLARGASKDKVYDSTRLLAVPPSRLYEDAHNPSEWRAKGFNPVLNERADNPEANAQGSLLVRMLELKEKHPLPRQDVLGGNFDFSLDRNQQCTTIEQFDAFSRKQPMWGMPFGLPGIAPAERRVIEQWVRNGAHPDTRKSIPVSIVSQIENWETFLNGGSLKARLVSRYIFEHIYLAALYFDGAIRDNDGQPYYFKLVRSSTPPGQAISIINTRRPYDDPNVSRVYYRFNLARETTLQKTHMPYALNSMKMNRWRQLFFDTDYSVNTAPSYSPQVAANPFVAFAQLPVSSRYRFMLDNSEFTIMGFIKGPVCRGQVALNVINDHFWVFFMSPDSFSRSSDVEFFQREAENLRLPIELESNAPVLATWHSYAKRQRQYLQAKNAYLPEVLKSRRQEGIKLIWDGDGQNPNAALTVFRHYDSASVVKGLVGQPPKTTWVIGYSLLERMHYLLVAGFDVYGNVGHQLITRLYMDFLRMEGEANFLALLPSAERQQLRDYWYRGAPNHVRDYMNGMGSEYDRLLPFTFHSTEPKNELMYLLKKRVTPALNDEYSLKHVRDYASRLALERLSALTGSTLQWLPQTTIMRLNTPQGIEWLTVINNSAHSNIAQIFQEQNRRLPGEDNLTVVKGIVGAYPNAFWAVESTELTDLITAIKRLDGELRYKELMGRFGIRRTSVNFWAFSDELHHAMRIQMGVSYGLLDYNRLEDR